MDGIPIDGVPCHGAVGECTSQCRHCRPLPSLLKRLAKVSGDERPDGRLLACAWGDVALGLHPYPSRYRMAFASSILLFPHTYRLALRLAFPRGRCTGFPCSVSVTHGWVRRALSTGSVDAHDKEGESPCARYSALLAQAWQPLWLVFCDDVSRAFTWVRPAIHPRPVSVVMLTETSVPYGCDASLMTVGSWSEGSVQVVTFPHIFVGYR
jgi:hypothetical protein